jgi:hypothetical protein
MWFLWLVTKIYISVGDIFEAPSNCRIEVILLEQDWILTVGSSMVSRAWYTYHMAVLQRSQMGVGMAEKEFRRALYFVNTKWITAFHAMAVLLNAVAVVVPLSIETNAYRTPFCPTSE